MESPLVIARTGDVENAPFVLGHAVPHLNIWTVPRYPGTPREYWGLRVDAWPQAPRGGSEETAALCERVRANLRRESHLDRSQPGPNDAV